MSTSLLYHGFGIHGYQYVRTAYINGAIIFTITKNSTHLRCPTCNSVYDHPISTGPLEGTINRIKMLQKQAYGFRDKEFFKLRIIGLHESKYALVG